MLGLLAIGVALILGVFVNLAAARRLAAGDDVDRAFPPENNPFMDDHLIYALTLGLLAGLGAGRWLGLGRKWEQTTLVQKVPGTTYTKAMQPPAPPDARGPPAAVPMGE